MKFENSEIIDSNGTKYRVGWDVHGWFSIESGEMFEGEFYADDQPVVSFPPNKVSKVKELIEQYE